MGSWRLKNSYAVSSSFSLCLYFNLCVFFYLNRALCIYYNEMCIYHINRDFYWNPFLCIVINRRRILRYFPAHKIMSSYFYLDVTAEYCLQKDALAHISRRRLNLNWRSQSLMRLHDCILMRHYAIRSPSLVASLFLLSNCDFFNKLF